LDRGQAMASFSRIAWSRPTNVASDEYGASEPAGIDA
jgi:hypothetical protein